MVGEIAGAQEMPGRRYEGHAASMTADRLALEVDG